MCADWLPQTCGRREAAANKITRSNTNEYNLLKQLQHYSLLTKYISSLKQSISIVLQIMNHISTCLMADAMSFKKHVFTVLFQQNPMPGLWCFNIVLDKEVHHLILILFCVYVQNHATWRHFGKHNLVLGGGKENKTKVHSWSNKHPD